MLFLQSFIAALMTVATMASPSVPSFVIRMLAIVPRLLGRGKDGQLVIVRSSESQVVEATRGLAAGTIKRFHVRTASQAVKVYQHLDSFVVNHVKFDERERSKGVMGSVHRMIVYSLQCAFYEKDFALVVDGFKQQV
ncbi:MAG: hypothetical protein M2R45_02205 [Verrucomicrobia subdivision 3 bacterium]|nr:hypothetical protein [Limisphaerales bacterium]MCS1413780.1 hypothetical protein [Limisphaerales bacterium]